MLAAATSSSSTTQSASAYLKKVAHDKGNHNGKGNGNTDTDTNQKCKQFASGLDPTFGDQNCQILSNSTISQAAETPKTCQECFTSLTLDQINTIPVVSTAFINCTFLVNFTESEFRTFLISAGIDVTVANNLIACLRDVGIEFRHNRNTTC